MCRNNSHVYNFDAFLELLEIRKNLATEKIKMESNINQGNRYKLSFITFTLITGAALLQTRDYPTMAVTGWNTIIFNLLAVIMFLLPCGLVAAELATGLPGEGGVYVWVKEAFGEHWDLLPAGCSGFK